MQFFDPPPVRYFGSKWQLADWIVAQMPPHCSYVEPFCGSAAVFFRKPPSGLEVLNDLNSDVVNFFTLLRDQTESLVRLIDLTPFSREEYERSFEVHEDPLERARRFYVRSWQGFRGGGTYDPKGWSHRTLDTTRSNTRDWSRLDGLFLGARRLKDAQIEHRDALELLERYDSPDTLFYIDPPYVISSRSRSEKKYIYEMDDSDHRTLSAALHALKGMVLLSGYDSRLYRELYGDWLVTRKSNTTNGNGTSMEYLWLSPAAVHMNRLPLFAMASNEEP